MTTGALDARVVELLLLLLLLGLAADGEWFLHVRAVCLGCVVGIVLSVYV
jgi:hypothetical protein